MLTLLLEQPNIYWHLHYSYHQVVTRLSSTSWLFHPLHLYGNSILKGLSYCYTLPLTRVSVAEET